MGNKLSSSKDSIYSGMEVTESEPSTPIGDVNPKNGLIFNDILIPEEISILILDFVDCVTLRKACLKVCQKWGQLTMEVFKIKCVRKYPAIMNVRKNRVVPPYLYENIACARAYEVNLLKNTSGEDDLNHWRVKSNGGDHWVVQQPPTGTSITADGIPEYSPASCFATSYHLCSKSQTVDLYKRGVGAKIMDTLQPHILVSELYASRFDCASVYFLKVYLLNAKKQIVQAFEYPAQMSAGNSWQKVTHTFSNYGPGVKYVVFNHEGKDSQFWSGHYGSKMAEATLRIPVVSLFEKLPILT